MSQHRTSEDRTSEHRTSEHRTPYVGTGEDGARRSARIDDSEADGLDRTEASEQRREALWDSAERWREQAHDLVLERIGARPTLAQVRDGVGSEDWLAALALVELCPRPLGEDLARFTSWARDGGRYTYDDEGEGEDRVSTFHPDPEVDWFGWMVDVETTGRGWSSAERRLYQLVVAVVMDDPIVLSDALSHLGSWQGPVLSIVVQWASGGDQRERPGRYTVTEQAGEQVSEQGSEQVSEQERTR